jgi:hypothetical protein
MSAHYGSEMERIKKRILFGTDWHVLTREKKYETYQSCYKKALENSGFGAPEVEGVLGGNALDFLGLRMPGNNTNRTRLERFYKNHDIQPPAWFKSLS